MASEPPPAQSQPGEPPAQLPPAPDDEAKGFAGDEREQRRSLVWKNLIVRTFDLEREFDRIVRRHIHGLLQETLENLEGVKGWTLRHGVRSKQTEGDFFLFDVNAADLKIQKVTRAVYNKTILRGGSSLLADLGLAVEFSLNTPMAQILVAQQAIRIKGINETLAKQLKASLEEGIRQGASIDVLRDEVRRIFNAGLGRSRIIARTEVGSAFNGARNLAMQQSNITRHEWLSSRDPDVRETHALVDAEVVAVGQPFSNGLRFPQDPSGPVAEVANCRCVALPVVATDAA
jgi:hypothetical protein